MKSSAPFGTPGGEVAAPGRVLLVEDDPDTAEFFRHVLTKRGRFEVTHTTDPVIALALAISEVWDLVLAGADLPVMSGHEVRAALRTLAPGLPVILVAHPLDSCPPVLGTCPPVLGTCPPVPGTCPPVPGTCPPVPGTCPPVLGIRRPDAVLAKPVRADHLLAAIRSAISRPQLSGRPPSPNRPIALPGPQVTLVAHCCPVLAPPVHRAECAIAHDRSVRMRKRAGTWHPTRRPGASAEHPSPSGQAHPRNSPVPAARMRVWPR